MPATKCCTTPLEVYQRVERHLRLPSANRKRDCDVLRTYIDEVLHEKINDPDCNRKPDLQRLIGIFGRVIFGSEALKTVEFCWDETLYQADRSLGATDYPSNGSTVIILEPAPEQSPSWRNRLGTRVDGFRNCQRTDGILDTLLHECIHAILTLEGCNGRSCGCEQCKEIWDSEIGKGGHGDVWHRIAKITEDFVKANSFWAIELSQKDQAQSHFDDTGRMLSKETVRLCWPDQSVSVTRRGWLAWSRTTNV